MGKGCVASQLCYLQLSTGKRLAARHGIRCLWHLLRVILVPGPHVLGRAPEALPGRLLRQNWLQGCCIQLGRARLHLGDRRL